MYTISLNTSTGYTKLNFFTQPNKLRWIWQICHFLIIYSVSQKNPPLKFSDIFPKRLGIFSQNFTHQLYVPISAGLQIFIQLPATLTKLCQARPP